MRHRVLACLKWRKNETTTPLDNNNNIKLPPDLTGAKKGKHRKMDEKSVANSSGRNRKTTDEVKW